MSMTVLVLPKRHHHRHHHCYQHQYYPNRKPRRLPILISLFIMSTLTLSYLIRHAQASTITTSSPQPTSNHRHRHSNHKNIHQDDSHASNYHKSHTITNGNQAQTSHYSITTMQTILKSYQKQNDDSSYESSDTQLTTVSDDDTALVNNVRHQRYRKLKKRDFYPICKGVYDKSIYARLDRICEDCFNLFHEPELHLLCRRNCFKSEFFQGCVETLQLSDRMDDIQVWVKQLNGADPLV